MRTPRVTQVHQARRRWSSSESTDRTAAGRFAVLVDAENVPHAALGEVLDDVRHCGGEATIRRVYGDFSKPSLEPWRQVSLDNAFRPVNTFSFVAGKGSAGLMSRGCYSS